MIIYWVIYFSTGISAFLHAFKSFNQIRWLVFLLLYIGLVSFAGFRYASVDYFGYKRLFYNTSFNNFSIPFFTGSQGTSGQEFIWASASSAFNLLGLHFSVWVFFVAFISISIKFYCFKKYTPYFLLAVAIYITQSFIKDMGQLRNGLAGALLLILVFPIIKRNVFQFFLLVALAFGVQAYAIVALPLYWIYPFFIRLKYCLILLLVSLSIVSFYGGVSDLILSILGAIPFVPDRILLKVEGYSARDVAQVSIASVTGVTYVLIAILAILFKEKIHFKSRLLSAFSMFHFYGVALFLAFTGINTLNVRSLDLFSMTALPFLMLAPLYFSKGFTKMFFLSLVLVFCGLRLYANIEAFYPYENILY